ncbi:E3 ubiquitin-protein ligase BOI-like [Phragmites australis]|uniref:E3 ubiquitin-protein ligase BOI-like n=1 Tax=Phragmites australis TaxID=29695 RepID=UPI002D78AEB5|nr:E3 ubiquitin-protein ligase BOI-like [Phragmites australis]
MAVEAHNMLHTGGQKLAHAGWAGGGSICCEAQEPGRHAWYGYGKEVAGGAVGSQHQQGYQQSCMGLVAPSTVAPLGRYGQVCAADASESGVTFGGAQEPAPRKRKRAEQPTVLGLGAADVAAQFQQQLIDVDRLVLQHTAKMWAELTEQRRRHARQVVAAVEATAAKRLRAKDEEIERIGRLNWALEERMKSLYVEAQVWRDLAQSNEARANALRGELQQALDAQARRCVGAGAGDGAAADDAESCCCGENGVAGDAGAVEEDEVGTTGSGTRCKVCGEGAAEVLLLPCRHLCACAPCAAAARACPACGCANNGSVCVNFS